MGKCTDIAVDLSMEEIQGKEKTPQEQGLSNGVWRQVAVLVRRSEITPKLYEGMGTVVVDPDGGVWRGKKCQGVVDGEWALTSPRRRIGKVEIPLGLDWRLLCAPLAYVLTFVKKGEE